jgi:hypothetical protein
MSGKSSGASPFPTWIVCILSIATLYLASVPPVYSALLHFTRWDVGRSAHWANRWIDAYGRPYIWLHIHTPLRKPLGAYCHWWVPDIGLP